MYDKEIAGKLSNEVKNSPDQYTALKALEQACELEQNKSVNTFLQRNVPTKVQESQVLVMRTQRTELATTKANKWHSKPKNRSLWT